MRVVVVLFDVVRCDATRWDAIDTSRRDGPIARSLAWLLTSSQSSIQQRSRLMEYRQKLKQEEKERTLKEDRARLASDFNLRFGTSLT